jgi:predicted HTH domain antitoxin
MFTLWVVNVFLGVGMGVGEMKLRLALELYRKGGVSFGRMAKLTGLSQRGLFLEPKRRNIPFIYGEDRFSEEVSGWLAGWHLQTPAH